MSERVDLDELERQLRSDLAAVMRVKAYYEKTPSRGHQLLEPPAPKLLPEPRQSAQVNVAPAGGVTAKMREVFAAQPSKDFAVSDLIAAMRAQGFSFGTARPDWSVGQAVRRLCRRVDITLSVRGSGSTPHRYRLAREGRANNQE